MAETAGCGIEGLFIFTIGELLDHESYVCNRNLQSRRRSRALHRFHSQTGVLQYRNHCCRRCFEGSNLQHGSEKVRVTTQADCPRSELWFSKRRNHGAQLAEGDILFLIDDDMEFPGSNTVSEVIGEVENPRVGAVAISYMQGGALHHGETINDERAFCPGKLRRLCLRGPPFNLFGT